MKRFLRGGLVGFCTALLLLNTAAEDVTLPVVGKISVPGMNWREVVRTNEVAARYRFVVLKETTTDATLSFAVYNKRGADIPTLLNLADSAHELFPTGEPWQDASSDRFGCVASIHARCEDEPPRKACAAMSGFELRGSV